MRQNLCLLLVLVCGGASGLLPGSPREAPVSSPNPVSILPLNPRLYGINRWHVGESSEYTLILFRAGVKEVKRIRYAILSAHSIHTEKYFLVENQVTEMDERRRTTINAVTRPFGDLTNLLEGATGLLVTKKDQQAAQAISLSLLRQELLPLNARSLASAVTSTENLDEESIETPAGKFKTTHQRFRFDDGRSVEVWWSRDAGPLGVVKAISKHFSLELYSRQPKKSVSAITENPVRVIE